MPLPEILYRVAELVKKRQLRISPVAGGKIIQKALAPGEHYQRAMDLSKIFPEFVDSSNADLKLAPRIFGRTWPIEESGEINWHRKLDKSETSGIWGFDLKYRSQSGWKSDIRQLWELNRLVWILPIAMKATDSANEDHISYIKKTLHSFIQSDRPGYSARWNSAIEISIQALALISVERILGERSKEVLPKGYLWALANRLKWIENLPSKYSSENNHRVAEIVAQIVIRDRLGIFDSNAKSSLKDLNSLVLKQFENDGINSELSFGYHSFVLDILATGRMLTPRLLFTAEVSSRLQASFEKSVNILDFCGLWPSANDEDEASVLGILCKKGEPPIELIAAAFNFAKPEPISTNVLDFQDSGYLFVRGESKLGRILLMVDYGRLGLSPLFAHAHADAQSFWLWFDGVPICVEAGTYAYHSDEEYRRFLQGSLAHNSISINGRSILEPKGPFMWEKSDFPNRPNLFLSNSRSAVTIELMCELPRVKNIKGKVLWHRRIDLQEDEIVVSDSLQSPSPLKLGSHFILSDKCKPFNSGDETGGWRMPAGNFSISGSQQLPRTSQFEYSTAYSHTSAGHRVEFASNESDAPSVTSKIKFRK